MCQLKKDIAADKLICSVNTECQLAAYALQAETGDYDGEDDDLAQLAWFLKMSPNMETAIRTAHKTLRGVSPLDADVQFLEIARKLESYGVHQYEAVVCLHNLHLTMKVTSFKLYDLQIAFFALIIIFCLCERYKLGYRL